MSYPNPGVLFVTHPNGEVEQAGFDHIDPREYGVFVQNHEEPDTDGLAGLNRTNRRIIPWNRVHEIHRPPHGPDCGENDADSDTDQ